MSGLNCAACDELRTVSPEFVQSGVTEAISNSLKNNTGLNPGATVVHSNCEDLNNVNDCLIGRLPGELAAYDVCDWKDYMTKFGGNLYETLKAIIASDCGGWIRLDSMCEIITNIISPRYGLYGILPNTYGDDYPSHKGGRLEGGWLTEDSSTSHSSATWRNSCVGLRFSKSNVIGCDGSRQTYIWYCPVFINHRLDPDTPARSLLWSIDHDTLISWGLPDAFWRSYEASSWIWSIGYSLDFGGSFTPFRVRMNVDSGTGRLGVYYWGSLYGITPASDGLILTDNAIERVYIL